MKPIEFLYHLQAMCGRIHALDLLTLQGEMQNAHKEGEGIPEYINYLEDAQDKDERAKVPVTDTMLMVMPLTRF